MNRLGIEKQVRLVAVSVNETAPLLPAVGRPATLVALGHFQAVNGGLRTGSRSSRSYICFFAVFWSLRRKLSGAHIPLAANTK
jgi:hypothetical protein